MNVSIRPYELGDVPHLFEAARESTVEVFPWLPWCHSAYRVEEAREWVASQVEAYRRRTEFQFVIVSENSRFLGGCGLNQLIPIHRVANLGYWVRTSASGCGVAPGAVRALSDWAFSNTDLERLEILAAVENRRSQRVAEKAGAHREGISRSRLLLHGRFHDAVVYSIICSSRWDVRPGAHERGPR
jgi:RimJ/RimL family protein N-acetyltransferase